MGAQGVVIASSQTNTDGKYSKSGLEPGNYTVKVTKPNFEPEAIVLRKRRST